MNVTAPNIVATSLLPRLVTLVQARKQARWQWKNSAGEHLHKWVLVIDELDRVIAEHENHVAGHMDMFIFRTKREVIE